MSEVLAHWTAPSVCYALAATLACHEFGRIRLSRRGGDGRPPWESARQAWLFRTAIGWGIVMLVSPLGYWSHRLLFARVGLDLALACISAPLVVLGAPWLALASAAGRSVPVRRSRGLGAAERPAPFGPIAGIVVFLGTFAVWQIPAVLDASVGSGALWALQQACYLAAGAALWLQLVGSWPFVPRWDPVGRLALMVAALWGPWIGGVAMILAGHVRYPAFAGGPGTPLSKAMDQGVAGAVTCVLPLVPLGLALMWCFSDWLRRDEDEGRSQEVLHRAGPGIPASGIPPQSEQPTAG